MKRLGVVLSIMIALYSPSLAQSEAGAIFLLIAPGARAGGMGEAQTAVAARGWVVHQSRKRKNVRIRAVFDRVRLEVLSQRRKAKGEQRDPDQRQKQQKLAAARAHALTRR